ncbi:MAG: DUF488 domain-containing protein [Bacteroidales bacterium]
MFYRRKIILALLQMFDGKLEKIRLQKLLFLFSQRQAKSEYDFIPYRFGCYSYSANADMIAMVARGLLAEDKKFFTKKDSTDYLNQLKTADLKLLQEIKTHYGKMSVEVLMKHTYLTFPFYAIKSEVAGKMLKKEEFEIVYRSKPKGNKTILFTIGYEGISLEEYLVRLLKNDVKVLVDVRNNPLSMKYGFSKSQLKKYCESLSIKYVHLPDLGIQSEKRKKLNTQSDYDKLFTDYRKNILSKTVDSQLQILNLLKENERIALTCFEANIYQCHRKHLAEAIEKFSEFKYELKHI